MKEYIEYFIGYISIEKDASPRTIHKYQADLIRFQNYLKTNLNLSDFSLIGAKHIRNYLSYLTESYPYRSSSLANKINIIKHFFSFMHKAGYIKNDPSALIKTSAKRNGLPRVLNEVEIGKLLKIPEYNK